VIIALKRGVTTQKQCSDCWLSTFD